MTPTPKTDTASGTAAEVDHTGAPLPAVVDAELVPQDKPLAWFDDSEWNDSDDGDLAPPDASLLPLIPMNRKNGEGLVDPTTGEKTTTLRFIPMARMLTRAWWSRSFDERDQSAGGAPDCRSNDGTFGIGTFGPKSGLNPSGKCADCPMNTWSTPTRDGKPIEIDSRVARPCNASYEWMVGVPDTADEGQSGIALWRLRFNGIAFGPARDFWNSFTKRVPKIAPIGTLCQMALEVKETKNGKFLAPSFARLETYRRAQVAPLIARRDELIEEFRRIVAEELATRIADVDEQDHRVSGPAAGRSTDPSDDEAAF